MDARQSRASARTRASSTTPQSPTNYRSKSRPPSTHHNQPQHGGLSRHRSQSRTRREVRCDFGHDMSRIDTLSGTLPPHSPKIEATCTEQEVEKPKSGLRGKLSGAKKKVMNSLQSEGGKRLQPRAVMVEQHVQGDSVTPPSPSKTQGQATVKAVPREASETQAEHPSREHNREALQPNAQDPGIPQASPGPNNTQHAAVVRKPVKSPSPLNAEESNVYVPASGPPQHPPIDVDAGPDYCSSAPVFDRAGNIMAGDPRAESDNQPPVTKGLNLEKPQPPLPPISNSTEVPASMIPGHFGMFQGQDFGRLQQPAENFRSERPHIQRSFTSEDQQQWQQQQQQQQFQTQRPIDHDTFIELKGKLQAAYDENVALEEKVERLQAQLNSNASSSIGNGLGLGGGKDIVGDSEIRDRWLQLQQSVDSFVDGLKKPNLYGGILKPRGQKEHDSAVRHLKRLELRCQHSALLKMLESTNGCAMLVRAGIWAVFKRELFWSLDGASRQWWAGKVSDYASQLCTSLLEPAFHDRDFHRWRAQTAGLLDKYAKKDDVATHVENVIKLIEGELAYLLAEPSRFRQRLRAVVYEALQLDAVMAKQPAYFFLFYPIPGDKQTMDIPVQFSKSQMKVDVSGDPGKTVALMITPGLWKAGNARWQAYDDMNPLGVDGRVYGQATVVCHSRKGY